MTITTECLNCTICKKKCTHQGLFAVRQKNQSYYMSKSPVFFVVDANLTAHTNVACNFYRERKVLLSHKPVIPSTPILSALIHYSCDRAGSILYIKCSSPLLLRIQCLGGMGKLENACRYYTTDITCSSFIHVK